jgi:glycolate oxidase
MGRLAPSYCTQDGVVPRSRLPEIVERIADTAKRYRLRVANLMHAGDGNIHPIILYDDADAEEVSRVIAAGDEILHACVAMGGSLTGEHGIGIEKIGLMPAAFGAAEIDAMRDARAAFDPRHLQPAQDSSDRPRCIEVRRPRPRGGG